ncbi:hypothetical protein [Spirulina sp. 06S082]|nr:hypothetical protein [Spirulina sp. 06S082]MEA5469264.1 hypothetical protein [Spirulina sp. 06S082]
MGYYSEKPGSQEYPLDLLNLVYPIGVISLEWVGPIDSIAFR